MQAEEVREGPEAVPCLPPAACWQTGLRQGELLGLRWEYFTNRLMEAGR